MLVKLKGKIEDSSAKLDRKKKGSMPPCLHGFKFDHWHQNKRYRCHASQAHASRQYMKKFNVHVHIYVSKMEHHSGETNPFWIFIIITCLNFYGPKTNTQLQYFLFQGFLLDPIEHIRLINQPKKEQEMVTTCKKKGFHQGFKQCSPTAITIIT